MQSIQTIRWVGKTLLLEKRGEEVRPAGDLGRRILGFVAGDIGVLRLRWIMRFARDRASLRMTRRGRVENAGGALVGLMSAARHWARFAAALSKYELFTGLFG